jgi:hypothetical protein
VLPNSPSPLYPQQRTLLSARMAQVWYKPDDTCVTVVRLTDTAVATGAAE